MHKFELFYLVIRNNVGYEILPKKMVARCQVAWKSIGGHLLREDVALDCDFGQTITELLKGEVHGVHEVLSVDVLLVEVQQFGVNIPHELLQEGLLDLNSCRDGVTKFIHHELELPFLHVDLFIVAEQLEDKFKTSVDVAAGVDYYHA